MTALRHTLLLTVLTLSASAADAQASELVGTWQFVVEGSDAAEMAAYGPVLIFRADSTLLMTFSEVPAGAVQPVGGTYTVQGDIITATIGGEAEAARYWFAGGDLYIDDRGDVMHFRRKSE